ncbi:lipopolysaccharide biosynthesis protein [Actinomycetospora lemnae]|uniref:Oligosaccharide flippase family protein n=1 Tax=Actinomycetospora lemnae TaxID=3019891 RepID=A0ABT5SVA3_9PSEU|nr:oligosaccharide flippase family protein [Actinomycetospora sp. DW7H6]MDD7966793.1 oligosaccharide flippase family protein [Actinomycetospora sp. DW7H6]
MVWCLQVVGSTLVSPVLAHLLGPSDFGELSSAIALHQVLVIVAGLGIDQALVQQRAEDGDDRSARRLITIGTAFALLMTSVAAVTAPVWSTFLGFAGVSSLLVATLLWTVPAVAGQMMLALLLSQDRFRPFALVSLVAAVGGQVVGIGLLVGLARDAGVYAWGGVVSQFAAMALGIVLTRPAFRGVVDSALVRRTLALGLPLTLSMLSMFVLNMGDRVVIQRILGPAEVGRYQVAYIVGYVVVMLVGFTSQAWSPRIAGIADRARRWALLGRARDELYVLLAPVILGVTLAAPLLLRIVAPESFRPEGLVVVVFLVALSAYPFAASGASGRALVTERRTRPIAVLTGVAAVLNIAINIALLDRFGIVAAAGGTLVAFAIQALLQRRAVPGIAPLPRTPLPVLLGIVVVTAVSAASTQLPQTPTWNLVKFALAVACVPYFVLRLRRAQRLPDARGAVDPPAGPPD